MQLAIINDSSARLWGLTGRERIVRIAGASGLGIAADTADASLVANAAFAFDPSWMTHIAANPGLMLTSDGIPVLAHARSPELARAIAVAMAEQRPFSHPEIDALTIESRPELVNAQLRKRERPFVGALVADAVPALERASYVGAYKGVTDLLTKYLWPQFAFLLTRIAARIGLSPNMVTGIGLILCVASGYAFYVGAYWPGMAAGFLFMVLDTVDGKLARCTITSSWWGNVFDHGIDLIHPPFWWWAWAMGLAAYGTPLSDRTIWIALAVIVAAYVAQRLIEGAFIARYGMHIHVWRRFDSWFRLITARRNPNMAILLLLLVVGRPDLGYLAIAWWGALCCIVHLVRFAQADAEQRRGRPLTSWLAA